MSKWRSAPQQNEIHVKIVLTVFVHTKTLKKDFMLFKF